MISAHVSAGYFVGSEKIVKLLYKNDGYQTIIKTWSVEKVRISIVVCAQLRPNFAT